MKKAELGWVAGIVDGEGCIYIHRQRASRCKDLKSDSFRLWLRVTMGHKSTLARLRTILGRGTIQRHSQSKIGVNPSWTWMCAPRVAEAVLRILRPHLWTKRDECDVALKFMALPLTLTGGAGGNRQVPQHITQKRLVCYWKLRMLKSRWRFFEQELGEADRREIHQLSKAGLL